MTRQRHDLSQGLSREQQNELGNLTAVTERLAQYTVPEPRPEETAMLLAYLHPLVSARGRALAPPANGSTAMAPSDNTPTPTVVGPVDSSQPGYKQPPAAVPAGRASPAATPRTKGGEQPPDAIPAGEDPGWTGPGAGAGYWVQLAWSQTRFVDGPFWWATGLVMALGILVILLTQSGPLPALFVLVSPVLAALGVAYAFRPTARSLWEIERASPIRPLELLYARLGLVLTFNLSLSLVLLGLVAAQQPRTILWRLVLAWLGPMLMLAGSALYAAVRWGAAAGVGLPAVLWVGMMTWISHVAGQGRGGLLVVPSLDRLVTAISRFDMVPAVSLLLAAVGLALIRRGGRWISGEAPPWG